MRSSFQLMRETTTTARLPSGEIAGELTPTSARRSSSCMVRALAGALTHVAAASDRGGDGNDGAEAPRHATAGGIFEATIWVRSARRHE